MIYKGLREKIKMSQIDPFLKKLFILKDIPDIKITKNDIFDTNYENNKFQLFDLSFIFSKKDGRVFESKYNKKVEIFSYWMYTCSVDSVSPNTPVLLYNFNGGIKEASEQYNKYINTFYENVEKNPLPKPKTYFMAIKLFDLFEELIASPEFQKFKLQLNQNLSEKWILNFNTAQIRNNKYWSYLGRNKPSWNTFAHVFKLAYLNSITGNTIIKPRLDSPTYITQLKSIDEMVMDI